MPTGINREVKLEKITEFEEVATYRPTKLVLILKLPETMQLK